MQESLYVTGIVLKQTPFGEYDRRVCLLTREKGKITAFARGARKPGNRLAAATNPFAFGSLCAPALPNELVRSIFELKAIVVNGEYPGVPEERKLEESTRYALNYIAESSVEKLYTFTVSDKVLAELSQIASEYRKRFMDRPFKSLEILKTLC